MISQLQRSVDIIRIIKKFQHDIEALRFTHSEHGSEEYLELT